MLQRTTRPTLATGFLVLALAGGLHAQKSAFQNIQPKLQAFDDVHMRQIMLGNELQAGGRILKVQVDPAEQVGPLPTLMPTRLAWEASGLPWAGLQPVLRDDGVFVVSSDRRVHGLSPLNGSETWSCKLKADPVTQPILGPAGMLLGLDNGTLVCVDLVKGKVLWTTSLEDAKGGKLYGEEVQPVSQPVVAGDRIFVGTFAAKGSGCTGRLAALDAATGQRVWEKVLPHGVTQAPVVKGDAVWAGGGDQYGSFLAKDGQELKGYHLTEAPLGRAVGSGDRFFLSSGQAVFGVDALTHDLKPVDALALGKGIAAGNGAVVSTQNVLEARTPGEGTWKREGPWAGAAVVRGERVFAVSAVNVLEVLNLGDGKVVAATVLSAEPSFPRPLVHGNEAIVLEKLDKGFLLEAFQGPAWKRIWGLTLLDQLVTLPSFTAQGLLLWTQAGQLRMIR